MTTERIIPFGKPWITDEDRQAVLGVLQVSVLTHGPQGKRFEEEFGAFLGGNAHCVSVSSGMAALHLAYFQMGIGPGDEVIVPAQTHVATAHAVEMVGARPVFADCEAATGNMAAAKLENLITPRTKAIGLVHFLGIPCRMDEIMSVAERRGLKVIEDCALALGARYKGTHVGLMGDAGCFSFYPVKHITTGDGGMFVSLHQELAEKVQKARGFGVDRNFTERSIPGVYDVTMLGLNYRMSDINAALGRRQLSRISELLERRRKNFTQLKNGLSKVPDLSIIDSQDEDAASSHYCLSVVLKGPLGPLRDRVVKKLNSLGVQTSVYYPHPVPDLQYYRQKYRNPDHGYPSAAEISQRSIALPVGPHLWADDMDYIAQRLTETLQEVGRS